MAVYNDVIARNMATPDPREIPEVLAREVIQEATNSSVLLRRARRVPMLSRQHRWPILSVLPEGKWLTGSTTPDIDTAKKETTKIEWNNVYMTSAPMAVLVPIPDEYIDDAGVPLFDEVRPLIAQAFGKKLDQAAIFGEDVPSEWPTDASGSLYAQAVAAGNDVTLGTGADIGVDIADVCDAIEQDGFMLNGFVTEPGFRWRLIKTRATGDGQPIFDLATNSIYGETFDQVTNGSWNSTKAHLIAADWTKVFVGVHQGITFTLSDSATIVDASNNVVLSAFQQDTKILRAVMRVGFALASPVTSLASYGAGAPFAVLRPSGAPAS